MPKTQHFMEETMKDNKQVVSTVIEADIKQSIEEIAEKYDWSLSLVISKILTQAIEDYDETGITIGIN